MHVGIWVSLLIVTRCSIRLRVCCDEASRLSGYRGTAARVGLVVSIPRNSASVLYPADPGVDIILFGYFCSSETHRTSLLSIPASCHRMITEEGGCGRDIDERRPGKRTLLTGIAIVAVSNLSSPCTSPVCLKPPRSSSGQGSGSGYIA